LDKRKDYQAKIDKLSIEKENQSGVYDKSIVWQYYLAGKKKFSSLTDI